MMKFSVSFRCGRSHKMAMEIIVISSIIEFDVLWVLSKIKKHHEDVSSFNLSNHAITFQSLKSFNLLLFKGL